MGSIKASRAQDAELSIQKAAAITRVEVSDAVADESILATGDRGREATLGGGTLRDKIYRTTYRVCFHVGCKSLRDLNCFQQIGRKRVQWDLSAGIFSRADSLPIN